MVRKGRKKATSTTGQKNPPAASPQPKKETPITNNVLGETKKSAGQAGNSQQVACKKTAPTPKENCVQKELKSKLLTDYFPVRRSDRKTEVKRGMEKAREIEEQLQAGSEDRFRIKLFPEKGRGIVTKRPIRKGEFVLEYYGDLIDHDEAQRREARYAKDENIGCYMYYFVYQNKKYCIDATAESGRLGRLVNHSRKNCNLKTQYFPVDGDPHLILVAQRDIQPDEELLYDYGDHSRQALTSHPWLAQ